MADVAMAGPIVVNAKCKRPGVCNAMESLLVHRDVATAFLPQIGQSLKQQGVEVRGCPETCRLLPDAIPAKPEDYDTEYLALLLSAKVADGLDAPLEHINR